jgi:homoserine kinase
MAITARAHSSTSNLGWGFDAFGIALDAGFDTVTAELGGAGLELTVRGEAAAEIPSDPARNTAGRAVAALIARHAPGQCVRLVIRKGTRHGSGMGSSAASAAAAVVAVNELFGLRLTREALVGFAAEGERASAGAAHPDNVAPAIFGGFTIVEKAAPLRITSLPTPPNLRFVMATPAIHVATSTARGRLPGEVSMADYTLGCARSAAIVAAILTNDVVALGRAVEGSFVDAVRARLIPGFDRVREAARQAGATGVFISGAGPTVAAVIGAATDGEAVASAMREAFAAANMRCEARVTRVAPGASIVEGGA